MVDEADISLSVRMIPFPGSGERFHAIRDLEIRFVLMVALLAVVALRDSSGTSSLPMKFSVVVCTSTVQRLQ
jgi:hypothetical protein